MSSNSDDRGQAGGGARDMVANYLALGRKSMRYWKRGFALAVLVAVAGVVYAIKKPRIFRSEASAAVHDIGMLAGESRGTEEAQAELRARLDQIYGSRANLGRVVDELHLYPWLRGRTSRLKMIESFQDAITYTAAGRDAFKLEFVYQDPELAQRTVARLLTLYTEERRAAGQSQVRNDLASINLAVTGLETVLEQQEQRLESFERVNSDLIEQVRMRRLGQLAARSGLAGLAAVATAPSATPMPAEPGETAGTRRLRIRLAALQSRHTALERAAAEPSTPRAAPAPVTVEDSERTTTLRHTVSDLRDRLARLRTTYTEEYPDVQVVARRLAEAERELAASVAADRGRANAAAQTSARVSTGDNAAQARAQLESISREIEETRSALYAAVRADQARRAATPPAAAASGAATTAPQQGAQARNAAAASPRGNARAARSNTQQTPAPAPAATTAAPEPGAAAAATAASAPRPATVEGAQRLGSLAEVETTWDRLTSDLTTTRTRYQQLISRKFELQAQLDTVNTTGADVMRVIDPPTLPAEPEPPGRTRLAIMALLAAFVLGLGVSVLSGFLDARIYQPADLRRWGELPELPMIPDLRAAAAPATRGQR